MNYILSNRCIVPLHYLPHNFLGHTLWNLPILRFHQPLQVPTIAVFQEAVKLFRDLDRPPQPDHEPILYCILIDDLIFYIFQKLVCQPFFGDDFACSKFVIMETSI